MRPVGWVDRCAFRPSLAVYEMAYISRARTRVYRGRGCARFDPAHERRTEGGSFLMAIFKVLILH